MTLKVTNIHQRENNEPTQCDSSPLLLASLDCRANNAIGVFDSGIGGLTILQCIKELLPNERLIYFADNEYAPYGDKSSELIIERVNKIAAYFIAQQVKAIVIACNTATAIAIDQLRAQVNIPIIGVEPAIKPAVLSTKKKKIAILTTQATAENTRFNLLVKQHSANANVFIQPCPGLVEQIEQGQLSSEKTNALLLQYLSPLQKEGIDTLVLGCTHYPMLKNSIVKILGNTVTLIDTGLPVATQLKHILTRTHLLNLSEYNVDEQAECDLVDTTEVMHLGRGKLPSETQYQWRSSKELSHVMLEMFPYSWQLSYI